MLNRHYLVKRTGGELGQVGGKGHLPEGIAHPSCRVCARDLLLFFEILLPDAFGYAPGTRLAAYMCPEHNEIPSFESRSELGPDFWDRGDGHWAGYLVPPDSRSVGADLGLLVSQTLAHADEPDEIDGYIQVGGEADWAQEEERFVCACGAEMQFLCQVQEDYKFERVPGAPEQPDSSYPDGYVLFLGNAVYAFGCPKPCGARAVWFTVQN